MSLYRIKATCKDLDWRTMPVCEIGISPGNLCHEGEKLESILDWAAERFDHTLLTLSDTMYRHNFMAQNMSPASALSAAEKLGTDWLMRNHSILETYQRKMTLKRWDEWLLHPDFDKVHSHLMIYISECEPLRQALNLDIQSFMARKVRQGQNADLAKMRYHSFNLITEEIACYILMGRLGYYARAYPSHDMKSFSFMRRPDTPEALKGFENIAHVELTLNRRSPALKVAA